MITLTKEWLLKTIAELEEERDATPGVVNEDAAMSLAAMKLALASLEANGTLGNEGTITATQFKPVADLYEVTVPSGRSTTFTKYAAEASDCRVMGWSVQEYVKLERYQAAMLQGAEPVTTAYKLPAEAVYGYFAFNDHHGEEFFKKREDAIAFCKEAIEEYRQENAEEGCDPDEVRRTCWGIIMQEGTDFEVDNEGHIDYALTPELAGDSPVIPDGWVACSERMPDIGTEIFYFCQDDGLRDCGIVSSSNFSGKGDAELYVHAEGYDLRFGVDISHWIPLPASPQQK
ncbi:hypothetical protein BZY52_23090 [Enterobacter hormaechei]|uniref:DUF551 domain-containing protein n=1 Tax=Enterobacter hormaechei TaxID=158836 RepID=UPI000A38D79B|nr:DUF551 domain-containing protein [Enterobacter hormaechei]OUK73556.1 hypothetical protein BZY52_23090 [Enterobacter hormaechei]